MKRSNTSTTLSLCRILLLFEHQFEMSYFLQTFTACLKSKRLWRYTTDATEWYLYCNNGDSFPGLLHALYTLHSEYKFTAVMNLGIAGSLDDTLPIGSIQAVSSVVYHDIQTGRSFLPVKQCHSLSPSAKPLITVPMVTEGYKQEWRYFGTLLDMEGYFVAQWGEKNAVPVYLFKQVSDYNHDVRASVDVTITKDLYAYFCTHHKDWEEFFNIPFATEICSSLELPSQLDDTVKKLSCYFVSNRCSFSTRQKEYDSIRKTGKLSDGTTISFSLQPKNSENGYVCIEQEYRDKGFEQHFIGYVPLYITDYLHYFMNKTDYRRRNVFIARKKGMCVKKKPEGYGVAEKLHYSAVNAYNCPFECSYCYLQGFFRSDDIVVFANTDDVVSQILDIHRTNPERQILLYFGDFCDALVYDTALHTTAYIAEALSQYPDIRCEFRTKSAAYIHLQQIKNTYTIIPAWTLSTEYVVATYEKGTAPLEARFKGLLSVIAWGFDISVHIDPVVYYEGCEEDYRELFVKIAKTLPAQNVVHISLGFLRMNRDTYKAIRHVPGKAAITSYLTFEQGMYRYPQEFREKMTAIFYSIMEPIYGDRILYVCME